MNEPVAGIDLLDFCKSHWRLIAAWGLGVGTAWIVAAKLGTTDAEKVWATAYHANFEVGYVEGLSAGADNPFYDARRQGVDLAEKALSDGTAWPVYYPLLWWSLSVGLLLGVVAQYAVVLLFRMQRQLPLFAACALVPAVRYSRAYSILEMVGLAGEQQRATEIIRNRKLMQIQAVQELVTRRLMTVSDLDELAQSRLLQLASKELDRIVAVANRKRFGHAKAPDDKNLSHVVCPTCSKRVKFSRHFANQTHPCPNPHCQGKITFPASVGMVSSDDTPRDE